MNKDPWQVDLSSKSIKKTQKYNIVNKIIPPCDNKVCIEIGAETGVVTDFLRRNKGGRWVAGTLDNKWRDISLQLLNEDVVTINPESVDFKDSTFDIVLVSRPEHIENDARFFREVHRILKKSGDIFILTPHRNPVLFLNWVKEKVGLTMEQYDHYRPGYGIKETQKMLERIGFKILKSGSYCRLISETIELTLNAVYTFMNKKKAKLEGKHSMIEVSYRPASLEDVNRDKSILKVYKYIFPILKCISKLDFFLFFTPGYVMYMQGRK